MNLIKRPTSIVILLAVLIVAYVAIGTLYAVFTPAWQVPDEPAHYNYIRSLAEGRGLPVLEHGDYDQEVLGRLTSEGFPAQLPSPAGGGPGRGLSNDPLTYEDHQPPLYYLMATPIYLLFDGALLALRLLSVLLGAGLLIVAFGTVRTIFPERPALGLIAAAFIAFIPQHVAMTAGVNNDTLAELVVGSTLWALVTYLAPHQKREAQRLPHQKRIPLPLGGVRGGVRGGPEKREAQRHQSKGQPWAVGLLVGVALLTKTTAYVVTVVALAAVAIRWHREDKTRRWAVGQLVWIFAPALLVSAPWFIRNGLTYGWSDPLGLVRHKAVVQGQPRSSEWLAIYGWGGLLSRMVRTTFQSFWGQFGWMAVPLPPRIYQGLILLSILLIAGFLARLIRCRLTSPKRLPPSWNTQESSRPSDRVDPGSPPRWGGVRGDDRVIPRCLLLTLSALLTFSAFVWYNLTFVQHQGRYLFPALIPLATAAALGLETLTNVAPRQLRPWILIAFFAILAAFDGYCLFRIILPNL